MRVLLLKDNPADARAFAALLRKSEPDLALVPTRLLAEAVALVEQHSFDAAVIDLGLPGAVGLEALHAVRAAAPTLPIVVLTGEREEQIARQALQSGAQDYVLEDDVRDVHIGQTIRLAIERKLTEEALRERERELSQVRKMEAIGQLAAGIAHEINTPMQYIGDNVRFLTESIEELNVVLQAAVVLAAAARAGTGMQAATAVPVAATETADVEYLLEEIPRALAESAQGVGRVTRIVRAMKEFSHPGTQEAKDVDLAQAVDSALTVCRNEWKYAAEIAIEIPRDLPAVRCNPGEWNQVLLNLIVNAAHAIGDRVGNTGEQGLITISAGVVDRWIEVRVADTGTGIQDHVLARMYEPYFTTKGVGKGTGQGLAIAYKVVTKHGGTIACETVVGVGTTFRIRLPLTGAEVAVESTEALAAPEVRA